MIARAGLAGRTTAAIRATTVIRIYACRFIAILLVHLTRNSSRGLTAGAQRRRVRPRHLQLNKRVAIFFISFLRTFTNGSGTCSLATMLPRRSGSSVFVGRSAHMAQTKNRPIVAGFATGYPKVPPIQWTGKQPNQAPGSLPPHSRLVFGCQHQTGQYLISEYEAEGR